MDAVDRIFDFFRSWWGSFTEETPPEPAPAHDETPAAIPWSLSEVEALRADALAAEWLLGNACFDPAETRRLRSQVILYRTFADALGDFNTAYLQQ